MSTNHVRPPIYREGKLRSISFIGLTSDIMVLLAFKERLSGKKNDNLRERLFRHVRNYPEEWAEGNCQVSLINVAEVFYPQD